MNSPPLFVSFHDVDHYLEALPHIDKVNFENEIRQLLQLNLPPVVSVRCLGVLFGFSSEFVWAMYHRTARYYSHFTIPKGRGKRDIHAPRIALKIILSWFGSSLAPSLDLQPCVYGFVRGKSAIQAAKIHCGAAWIFSTDIKDFFPSTSKSVVKKSLMSIGYSEVGAEIMSKLCCYDNGLAQGSPASPALSNLAFSDADKEIIHLAEDLGVNYTRYADDLVFSGSGKPPDNLDISIRTIIERYGWEIADHKQTLVCSPKSLKVHGLLVNGTTPRLTKSYRNRIRAFRHIIGRRGNKAENFERIQGHLSYAKSVEEITNT
jgi:RNA-directed DNA polymerase